MLARWGNVTSYYRNNNIWHFGTQGDSGGPLTYKSGDQHVLIGDVSGGNGCGQVSNRFNLCEIISSTELISDSPDLVHGGTEREGLPFPSHEVHVGNNPAQSVRVGVQLKQDLQVEPPGLFELLERFTVRRNT